MEQNQHLHGKINFYMLFWFVNYIRKNPCFTDLHVNTIWDLN